jgi:hypothetical protein
LLKYIWSFVKFYMILFNTWFWMQFIQFILHLDYGLCVTWITPQQLWVYNVEKKLHFEYINKKKVEYHWLMGHLTWIEIRLGMHFYLINTSEFEFLSVNTWPPLRSSGQSSWLQIRRRGFDSRHYQKKKVVGLERGPLSLVSTTEELLDRKVPDSVQKTENTAAVIRHADHVAPSIRKSW